MKRILFVCHGNICRSPMAESVFAEKVRARKLEWAYDVDSAAVSSEEIGNPVHPGTQRELARHGLPLSLIHISLPPCRRKPPKSATAM